MNHFPCHCDLADSKPISWIWPVTWIPELPRCFLTAQVGAAASWEISWRDTFIQCRAYWGWFVTWCCYCKISKWFSEGFPNLWYGFGSCRSERILSAVGFITSDQNLRTSFSLCTPSPSCVPSQACSYRVSSVCGIYLSDRGFAVFNWCFTIPV